MPAQPGFNSTLSSGHRSALIERICQQLLQRLPVKLRRPALAFGILHQFSGGLQHLHRRGRAVGGDKRLIGFQPISHLVHPLGASTSILAISIGAQAVVEQQIFARHERPSYLQCAWCPLLLARRVAGLRLAVNFTNSDNAILKKWNVAPLKNTKSSPP